jgi:hypothetical protein
MRWHKRRKAAFRGGVSPISLLIGDAPPLQVKPGMQIDPNTLFALAIIGAVIWGLIIGTAVRLLT